MIVWVVKWFSGRWSIASESLSRRLENENPLRPINVPLALSVTVKALESGDLCAERAGVRLVAFIGTDCYGRQAPTRRGWHFERLVQGIGWVLADDAIEEEEESVLCTALGLPPCSCNECGRAIDLSQKDSKLCQCCGQCGDCCAASECEGNKPVSDKPFV